MSFEKSSEYCTQTQFTLIPKRGTYTSSYAELSIFLQVFVRKFVRAEKKPLVAVNLVLSIL